MTLFPDTPSLSPRRAWLDLHGLRVWREPPPHPWFGCPGGDYVCANRAHTKAAFADSEDEAILAYCARYNLQHYSITEWNTRTSLVIAEIW